MSKPDGDKAETTKNAPSPRQLRRGIVSSSGLEPMTVADGA